MIPRGAIFERDLLQDGSGSVIDWWEQRRPWFNLVVGCTGIITCVLMVLCGFLSEPLVGEAIGLPDPVFAGFFGVVAYAIAANICYTAGWVAEVMISRSQKRSATAFGLKAFRYGLRFSVVVTFLPALLCWALFLFLLATGQKNSMPGS
jgi:hypothetical protein